MKKKVFTGYPNLNQVHYFRLINYNSIYYVLMMKEEHENSFESCRYYCHPVSEEPYFFLYFHDAVDFLNGEFPERIDISVSFQRGIVNSNCFNCNTDTHSSQCNLCAMSKFNLWHINSKLTSDIDRNNKITLYPSLSSNKEKKSSLYDKVMDFIYHIMPASWVNEQKEPESVTESDTTENKEFEPEKEV